MSSRASPSGGLEHCLGWPCCLQCVMKGLAQCAPALAEGRAGAGGRAQGPLCRPRAGAPPGRLCLALCARRSRWHTCSRLSMECPWCRQASPLMQGGPHARLPKGRGSIPPTHLSVPNSLAPCRPNQVPPPAACPGRQVARGCNKRAAGKGWG